jgi:uncharacterized membrane protein YdbT with pleckstrin-like domain
MGYIDKSLADAEDVVMTGRWPTFYWFGAWFTLAIFVLATAFGLATLGVGALVLLAIGGVWFCASALHMKTTEFAVTNQRVALKRGWLTLSTQELAVANIEEVRIEQSLFGRLFGFGRVIVTGTGEGVILFPPLAHPIEFRRAIENARTHARAAAAAAPPPAPEETPDKNAKKKKKGWF